MPPPTTSMGAGSPTFRRGTTEYGFSPDCARVDTVAAGVYDGALMSEMWKDLRNSFFAGLLVVVPVAASVLILIGIFTWVTDFMLPDALRQQMLTPLYRVIALVLFVVFTIATG